MLFGFAGASNPLESLAKRDSGGLRQRFTSLGAEFLKRPLNLRILEVY